MALTSNETLSGPALSFCFSFFTLSLCLSLFLSVFVSCVAGELVYEIEMDVPVYQSEYRPVAQNWSTALQLSNKHSLTFSFVHQSLGTRLAGPIFPSLYPALNQLHHIGLGGEWGGTVGGAGVGVGGVEGGGRGGRGGRSGRSGRGWEGAAL